GLQCALTGGLAVDARFAFTGDPSSNGSERYRFRRERLRVDSGIACRVISPTPRASGCHRRQDADAAGRRTARDSHRPVSRAREHAVTLDDETGELNVLSVEDLVARTTALVCGRLRRGQKVDVRHAR